MQSTERKYKTREVFSSFKGRRRWWWMRNERVIKFSVVKIIGCEYVKHAGAIHSLKKTNSKDLSSATLAQYQMSYFHNIKAVMPHIDICNLSVSVVSGLNSSSDRSVQRSSRLCLLIKDYCQRLKSFDTFS